MALKTGPERHIAGSGGNVQDFGRGLTARTFLAALYRPASSEGALRAEDGDFTRAAAEVT